MADALYRQILLDHWKNPKNTGTISHPTKRSVSSNPSCGDKIAMDVIIKKNRIYDIKFRGEGCVLSQASSSLLTEYAKGKTVDHIQSLDTSFMQDLLEIPVTPVRLKCILLSLETLQKALHSPSQKQKKLS